MIRLCAGHAKLSVDNALRIGIALGTGPEVWLGLQQKYDIVKTKRLLADKLSIIHPYTRRLENHD